MLMRPRWFPSALQVDQGPFKDMAPIFPKINVILDAAQW